MEKKDKEIEFLRTSMKKLEVIYFRIIYLCLNLNSTFISYQIAYISLHFTLIIIIGGIQTSQEEEQAAMCDTGSGRK